MVKSVALSRNLTVKANKALAHRAQLLNFDRHLASQHPIFLFTSIFNITTTTMVSLLDLPGEIRNQIWELCLVSPTGTIALLSRREAYHRSLPGSCSQSGPFFYLLVDNTNPGKGQQQPYDSDKLPPTISLSLPRTCRKIYEETNELFWTSNTFYFSTPHILRQNFRSMGILAQRRIFSIRLRLRPDWGNDIECFDRAMQLLINQGKNRSIRHTELLIDINSIEHMAGVKPNPFLYFSLPLGASNVMYKKFLPILHQANRLQNLQRNFVATHACSLATVEEILDYSVANEIHGRLRDLHEAWGGRFYWGSTLVWDAKNASPELAGNVPLEELVKPEDVETESVDQGELE